MATTSSWPSGAARRRQTVRASACMALFLCLLSPALRAQQPTEQVASHYYQNKEYDKAVELYESLYRQTNNKFYYQMLRSSYMALEQWRDAERLTQKRLKQYPADLYLYVDLAELQQQRGEKKRAAKTLDEAVAHVGYNQTQLLELTAALVSTNNLAHAEKAYLTARTKSKNPFLYVSELATLYERMGRYDKMMQEYFTLLDHSPTLMGNIQLSLQRTLAETSNPKLASELKRVLMDRIADHPENQYNLEMMIWYCLQQKDFKFALTQSKAVALRFPQEGTEQVMRVAGIAANNADYATALEGYRFVVGRGKDDPHYFDAHIEALNVMFLQLNADYALSASDLAAMRRDYEQALAELGKTPRTAPLMRHYAHLLAYYGGELQAAVDMLYDVIEMPRLASRQLNETKLELGGLLLFAGAVWDASLLYSQVEKANKEDILGAQAKFRNAKLSYYNHDFLWAKSQLDVLRASTSKLIANDAMELSLLIGDNMEEDSTFTMLELYASADLLLYRNQLDSAWNAFDAIGIRTLSHPILDEVLMQKARIRMKQGRYAEADTLLQRIVELYGDDILADDALYQSGQLNEHQLKNPDRARQCYERLLLDYPSSLYADQARKRYDALLSAQ